MKRAVRITLSVAAVIALTIIAAWAFFFWTPPGRASLKPFLEASLAAAAGGEVDIGALEGRLPGEIILEEVRLSHKGEDWLTVARMELAWRPFALLSGKVAIDSACLDGARLVNTPPEQAEKREKPRGFELPEKLPNISVKDLKIADFRVAEALAGSQARFDAAGAVKMGGRMLALSFDAASSGDRDYAHARVERTGDALAADITVKSGSDGAIAAIANFGGALFVEAKGDGALDAYKLEYSASLGAYGDFDGALLGDFERMEKISFSAKAELGEKLSSTAKIIGTDADVSGDFIPLDDGGELRLSNFQSALGTVEGSMRWRNRGKALETVSITASARLNQSWRPDIRPYIGGAISIDGEVRPKGDDYSADAQVTATYFDATLKGLETDLRDFARGPASIALKTNEALPKGLAAGAKASGDFDLRFGDSIKAAPIELRTAEGGAFSGDAAYNFDTRAFAVKGKASASPDMTSSVNAKLAAKRNAGADIDIKGTRDKFAGTVVAVLPPLLYDGKAFPAAHLSLAFADAPAAISGQVALRAIDQSIRLKANFARSADGALHANGVDYIGADFALKGSAAILPHADGAILDLAYRGVDDAEPWPGLQLAGDFTVKGAVARGASENSLSLKAGALVSQNWSVHGLSAEAAGPADRLIVTASAASLAGRGATPATGVSAEMSAAFRDALVVTLTGLSADIAGAPMKLSRPAQIKFGDGVSVETFRAAIGDEGSIALDGALSKARWRAKIAARRAPIVSAASVIDLDLDLDTDRQAPANGTFLLTSLLTKTEDASLSGRLIWNGAAVALSSEDATRGLDLKLSLPAKLIRRPAISVRTDGPLSGEARYSGRAEPLAGFLPAALQSLEGAIKFHGQASGTLADPKLSGDLAISNGAFTELSSGFSIVNIVGTARAESAVSGSRIEFAATGSGVNQQGKTVTVDGVLTLGKGSHLASKLTLNGAKLSAGPVTEVDATGEVSLSGPVSALLAKGDVTIKSLDARVFTPETTGLVDINVVRTGADGVEAAAANSPMRTSISLAIGISGDDRIFIRGRGLASEWSADVNISGRAAAPVIVGSMTMKKGEITFSGRRFEMTKGEISFDRLSINNPSLDLRAERETKSGILAAIVIEGRARAPKISLTSTPALPQEDIMALILFDKPASELTAIESLQVAESLAELSGIGPFGGAGITSTARQALGLDLLSLDVDEADGAASSLTVGKYVSKGLFVSATQDARGENGSVRIEYEIDNSFTVETELRQDGDQKASVNWKRDF